MHVQGGSSQGITYVIRNKSYESSEDRARKQFDSYKISSYLRGDTAWIVGEWDAGRPHKFSSDITVTVPREMDLVGVGFRAAKQGSDLVLTLGYSHPIRYSPPEGITIEVPVPTQIVISGADKETVGQVAAKIRSFRKPEPYKGKGVLYRGERLRRKAGKSGKAGKTK